VHRADPNKNTHDPWGRSGPKKAWCVGYNQKVTNTKSAVISFPDYYGA
jgi:hypothetical protein